MRDQEEQERRSELLLRALEAYPDPEQALALAVRMEQFIVDGRTSLEKPEMTTQPASQPSSEGARKTYIRSRWTGEDDAELRRLKQDGITIESIAQKLQRTPAGVYSRMRHLGFPANRGDNKKGNKNSNSGGSSKKSPNSSAVETKGFDAVGIDSVVHFLRTRDYSVTAIEDGRYKVDGRRVLTAQELFERANEVRTQLGRPAWAALENGPIVAHLPPEQRANNKSR